MREKMEKYFHLLLCGVLTVGIIWLSVRFFLPWAAPFILAYIFASLLEPAVKRLEKKGIKRSAAAAVLNLGAVFLLGGLTFFLCSKCMDAAGDFIKKSPELVSALGEGLDRLRSRAFSLSSAVPESMEQYIRASLKALLDSVYSIPGIISQKLMDFLTAAAQKSPSILLFTVTAGLGSYFISAGFPDVTAFLLMQLPKELRHKIRSAARELKGSLGGFFRAQLILMAMSFFELLLFFFLLDVENPAPAAALTAVIDALPVFGTGIVLIPWALYSLLLGDYSRAAGFIICWSITNLLRSCVQAKLTGDQIGLSPIASLWAIYMGYKVWGVGGMLIFPLLFSILRKLQDKGIIRLWKTA